MKNYPSIGIQVPQILLPRPGVDLTRWAVIACDQFTSQPDYWQQVEVIVGAAPSTFNLILPEIFLGKPEEFARVQSIRQAMQTYLHENLFIQHEGMILVERQVAGKTRHGLMLALDLEAYDFNKGSQTLIRATEGTILDRLPPRMKIREGALLELPHIMVLIDDPQRTVIEPLLPLLDKQPALYDFDLMLGSGHLRGTSVKAPQLEAQVIHALEALADPQAFRQHYGLDAKEGVLLFAMGDGNHSLATAKAVWEKMKPVVGMDHPARYALVEIENVHDEGLEFEPIHRVLFNVEADPHAGMQSFFAGNLNCQTVASRAEMVSGVNQQVGSSHKFGMVTPPGFSVVEIHNPSTNLPVGTLQTFLDEFVKSGQGGKIDYVHGEEVVCTLGAQPGHVGFFLPGMPKDDLFKTVLLDGALPRKTFSMGEALEKRFYMESRKIA